jgi:Bacterial TniB protein
MNTVDQHQSTVSTTPAGDAVPCTDDGAAPKSMDLGHLDPIIRPIAQQEDLPRAQHILKDLYVNHPPVQRIERQIEHLLRLPRRIRMPGLFLCGDSGMGKTHLLRRIERRHPEQTDRASQRRVRPVLYVQVPADPTVRTLRRSLLDEANIPFLDRPGRPLPESILRRGLAAAGTRLIVLDEIHNIEHVKGDRRVLLRGLRALLVQSNPTADCACGNRGIRARPT